MSYYDVQNTKYQLSTSRLLTFYTFIELHDHQLRTKSFRRHRRVKIKYMRVFKKPWERQRDYIDQIGTIRKDRGKKGKFEGSQ